MTGNSAFGFDRYPVSFLDIVVPCWTISRPCPSRAQDLSRKCISPNVAGEELNSGELKPFRPNDRPSWEPK